MSTHRYRVSEVEAREIRSEERFVDENDKLQIAKPGNWIVTRPDGTKRVFKNEAFQDEFEVIPEPKKEKTK